MPHRSNHLPCIRYPPPTFWFATATHGHPKKSRLDASDAIMLAAALNEADLRFGFAQDKPAALPRSTPPSKLFRHVRLSELRCGHIVGTETSTRSVILPPHPSPSRNLPSLWDMPTRTTSLEISSRNQGRRAQRPCFAGLGTLVRAVS